MKRGRSDGPGPERACFRIVVRGKVTDRFAAVLDGVVVEDAGEYSTLCIRDADPAKLQGALSWLYDNGVELISVRQVDEPKPLS